MKAVIRNARFLWLLSSQIALTLGDGLMRMGLVEVLREHQHFDKRVEIAKLSFAVAVPGLIFGPLVMVVLDRWQRRSVLIVSDLIRGVVVLAIAFWLLPLLSGQVENRGLQLVYWMTGVLGIIATFYLAARSALLPNLVDTGDLVHANTIFGITLALATVGGITLGGLIAERVGVLATVLANVVMCLLSATLLWKIRMTPHATTATEYPGTRNGWTELRIGLEYLWTHATALPLVLLNGVFMFIVGILAVVFVGYAMDTLQLSTSQVGYLALVGGVGAAAGIGSLSTEHRWTKSTWFPVAHLVIMGGALVMLALTVRIWVATIGIVLLGGVIATMLIYFDARLQAQVEDARRGAVFAARGMLTSATMIVAFWLQFGTDLFRRTSAPTVFFWLGVGSMVVAVLAGIMVQARKQTVATGTVA
jgi:MFS family permease